MQLNKEQYAILMTIARSQNSMACYARRDCAHKAIPSDPDWSPILYRLMQVNAETPIPCNAPLWVERHYQSPKRDRLQEKQDRRSPYIKPELVDLTRAAYRLGQAAERSVLAAHQSKNPDDYDPAIAAERMLKHLHTEDYQRTYTYWSFVEGRNSIRKARGLELLNH